MGSPWGVAVFFRQTHVIVIYFMAATEETSSFEPFSLLMSQGQSSSSTSLEINYIYIYRIVCRILKTVPSHGKTCIDQTDFMSKSGSVLVMFEQPCFSRHVCVPSKKKHIIGDSTPMIFEISKHFFGILASAISVIAEPRSRLVRVWCALLELRSEIRSWQKWR